MKRFLVGIFVLTSLIFVSTESFAKVHKNKQSFRQNSFMITWSEFQKLTTQNKVNHMMEMRNIMIKAEMKEKSAGMKLPTWFG